MGFHVENLEIQYGRHKALDDVTLRFESGALGLLGPNGAGKSSLLRALLGFVRPARGEVSVLGQRLEGDMRPLRRRIGYHPEDDVQFPGMNGLSAVALCGELSGLPRSDALQRAHEILYFVGLGEARYRPAESYSQGMRQRLKLAQALVHDPELLILDEPTNGLDPRGRQEMLDLIRELAHEKGINLILSSHLLPDVERVCDQVALLHRGALVRSGHLDELLRSRHLTFHVRVKGPLEVFEAALVAGGASCEHTPHGLLEVRTPAAGAQLVFEAARESACQIRQITPVRESLTEMFASSVTEGAHADS
jgi:ABC-2 type transport system ATP-binding protein